MLRGDTGPKTLFKVYTKDFFSLESPWSLRQLDRERLQESTILWRKQLFDTHIKDYFANICLDEITPNQIDSWLTNLDKSGQTKDHLRVTLNIIFKEALRDRLVKENPVLHIEKAKDDHVPNDPPTMEELRALFPEDMDEFMKVWPQPIYGIMCEVEATTGLRMGEVRALTPHAIKEDLQGLLVTQAVKQGGEIGLPKKKEIRAVIIPKRTLKRLTWWMAKKQFDQDDLLFSCVPGNPVTEKVPYKYFKKALEYLEIEKKGRKLTVHGLRHAFNTRMREILTDAAIEGFWDKKLMCYPNTLKSADQILREYTGHKSDLMTDLYDHPDLLMKLKAFQDFKKYTDKFWDLPAGEQQPNNDAHE